MAKASQVMEKGSKPGQLTFSCWGKGWGEGIVRHGHAHTLYLKWMTNKDLLDSTGNSTQC